MSDNTGIEWATATWNPIRGTDGRHTCARISDGCTHCYAATMNKRGLGGTAALDYGQGETLNDPARLDETALLQPLRWKKPRRIFVCSMTDIAGSWVPDAWLDAIWAVMALAPQHTYIVLTKRPSRLWEWFRSDPYERVLKAAGPIRDWRPQLIGIGISNPSRFPYRRVWIGVSVESDRYVWRANTLRQIPAAVRWISAEPLLGGLPSLDLTGIGWLVTGGESGPGARPMHPQWARDLRDRCQANGTAFFHKQNGEYAPTEIRAGGDLGGDVRRGHTIHLHAPGNPEGFFRKGDAYVSRVGRVAAGRLLDGREHSEFPTVAAGAGAV